MKKMCKTLNDIKSRPVCANKNGQRSQNFLSISSKTWQPNGNWKRATGKKEQTKRARTTRTGAFRRAVSCRLFEPRVKISIVRNHPQQRSTRTCTPNCTPRTHSNSRKNQANRAHVERRWVVGPGHDQKTSGPKKAVLYVGNLIGGCSENNLLEFVEIRAKRIGEKVPQIFNVKMFEPRNENRCAHLTVAENDAVLLRLSNFWPRPIYARHCNFDRTVSPSNQAPATANCLSAAAENHGAHPTNSVTNEPELAAQMADKKGGKRNSEEQSGKVTQRDQSSTQWRFGKLMKLNCVTIGHVNVNRLRHKIDFVKNIIIKHKFSILAVTET